MCFWHFVIFALPDAGRFSYSRLRGTRGACPDTACKFGPWPTSAARTVGVRKWQVLSGRDSDHLEPSTFMQTQNHLNKMFDGMCMSFRILLAPRTGCLPHY